MYFSFLFLRGLFWNRVLPGSSKIIFESLVFWRRNLQFSKIHPELYNESQLQYKNVRFLKWFHYISFGWTVPKSWLFCPLQRELGNQLPLTLWIDRRLHLPNKTFPCSKTAILCHYTMSLQCVCTHHGSFVRNFHSTPPSVFCKQKLCPSQSSHLSLCLSPGRGVLAF